MTALVSGVAHEINTPLGISITASSHLYSESEKLMNKVQNQSMTRTDLNNFLNKSINSLEMVGESLEKVSRLVNNFKKLAVDQSDEKKSRFNILEYFAEIKDSIAPILSKENVNIILDGDEAEIVSYSGVLYQVFSNLIMNSVQYAFPGKEVRTISIDCIKNENTIDIKICDNGKGIPRESLSHIFEPFYTTGRSEGAAGLGLHIVYNLVNHKLQGSIYCDSRENEGTCFIISLPQKV